MSDGCPCGAPEARLAPHGTRSLRLLDHGPGFLFRDATRQRLRCRDCGATSSRGADTLVGGFRMTPAAFEALARSCLDAPYAEVAKACGLDETTVRSAFLRWSDLLLDPARLRHPPVAIVRSFPGPTGPWPRVVDGLDGRVCAAFPGVEDPRFAAYLSGFAASDVYLDVTSSGIAGASLRPGNVVTVHRLAVRDRIDALLPRCLFLLRATLPGPLRGLMRGSGDLLLRNRFDLTSAEMARRAALVAAHPLLRRFAEACHAIRVVWLGRDPVEASARVEAWRGSLCHTLRRAFAPVLGLLHAQAGRLFTESYGRMPREGWESLSPGGDAAPRPGRAGPLLAACRALVPAIATETGNPARAHGSRPFASPAPSR